MKKLRAELEKLADEKYRNFSAKLLPKTEKLMLLTLPISHPETSISQ